MSVASWEEEVIRKARGVVLAFEEHEHCEPTWYLQRLGGNIAVLSHTLKTLDRAKAEAAPVPTS